MSLGKDGENTKGREGKTEGEGAGTVGKQGKLETLLCLQLLTFYPHCCLLEELFLLEEFGHFSVVNCNKIVRNDVACKGEP